MNMQEQIASSDEGPQRHGNHDDADYDNFLVRLQARFTSNLGDRPLFETSAACDECDIFALYLDAFPPEQRQYHNCSACRHFVQRYGHLATIDDEGRTQSALWNEADAPELYKPSIRALDWLVRRSHVTGIFLSSQPVWGEPVTGIWKHMALTPPRAILHRSPICTAGQAMAEKREDRGTVARALSEFSPEHIAQAVTLLKTDALYRSEKVLGAAEWLAKLHAARAAAKGKTARENVLWLAVAQAPAGFCHPRSSMIGTLLEDLAAGKSYDEVSRAFKAKMHPLQYQRPQAAPTAGNIAQAEKLVAQLGIAASLRRRFARVDELVAVWRPADVKPEPVGGGVFAHLTPKGKGVPARLDMPPLVITWEKFARTVLPEAEQLECFAPAHGNYAALVTAADMEAPPILQWDLPEQRNPVSWYIYNGGTNAGTWGLPGGAYVKVAAVTLQPNLWHQPEKFAHHGKGVLFVLEGARESRFESLALFPECLRSELREVRATFEAYSRGKAIEGRLSKEVVMGESIEIAATTPWLDTKEAAAYLRTTPRALLRHVQRGNLRPDCFGRRGAFKSHRFMRATLDAFLQSKR